MRDKNQTYIQFENSISTYLDKLLDPNEIGVLRNHVVDSPTFLYDFTIKINTKNLLFLRGLALISYYIPENLGWYIRMELWEYAKRLSLKDQLKLKLLLDSKESALVYFYETNEFSSHEIFGNILRDGVKALKSIKIIRINKVVKKPQRKRGYHDHGSRTPDHKWIESNLGYVGRELQKEIDLKRYRHNRTYRFLQKYLCERSKLYKADGSKCTKTFSE